MADDKADILKGWLESTGTKAKEGRFLSPPAFPYLVYSHRTEVSGGDYLKGIEFHEITAELYSEIIDTEVENKLEELFLSACVDYSKERIWIQSEKMWETRYDFDFYCKKGEMPEWLQMYRKSH